MVTRQKPPQKAFNFPLLTRNAILPADKSQLPSRVSCASLNNLLCVWKQRHRTKPFATPTYTTLVSGKRCPFSDICQVASVTPHPKWNQNALSFNQWFSWRRANTTSPLPTTAHYRTTHTILWKWLCQKWQTMMKICALSKLVYFLTTTSDVYIPPKYYSITCRNLALRNNKTWKNERMNPNTLPDYSCTLSPKLSGPEAKTFHGAMNLGDQTHPAASWAVAYPYTVTYLQVWTCYILGWGILLRSMC